MKNPEKTDFNKVYFRTCNGGSPMSFADFKSYWKVHKFIGDPEKYYYEITGLKKTKKRKDDEIIDD